MRAKSVTLTAYSVANITNPNFNAACLCPSEDLAIDRSVVDIGAYSLTRDIAHVGRLAEFVAAFDSEALSGHPRRLGPGQVADCRRDVFGGAGATQWLLDAEALHERLVGV